MEKTYKWPKKWKKLFVVLFTDLQDTAQLVDIASFLYAFICYLSFLYYLLYKYFLYYLLTAAG